jgi:hypothetical protein
VFDGWFSALVRNFFYAGCHQHRVWLPCKQHDCVHAFETWPLASGFVHYSSSVLLTSPCCCVAVAAGERQLSDAAGLSLASQPWAAAVMLQAAVRLNTKRRSSRAAPAAAAAADLGAAADAAYVSARMTLIDGALSCVE